MASSQVSVGTAPTLLASAPPSAAPGPAGWFSIANGGTAGTVYVGGSGVTSSNGYPVIPAAAFPGYLWPGDSVFGVVVSGSGTVCVFQAGA